MTAQDRMSAGLEEAFYKRASVLGRSLVNQLAILVKVAQMHSLGNVAVSKAAESLVATVNALVEDRDSVALYLVGEHFFVEDGRVRYGNDDASNFFTLAAEFRKRKLGSLRFSAGLGPEEAIRFAGAFLSAQASAEPFADLVQQLSLAAVLEITAGELRPSKAGSTEGPAGTTDELARTAYVRVVRRIKELMVAIQSGRPPDIRMLKRASHVLIDSVYDSEKTLLRLTAVRKAGDVLPRHYVNVCVLSLLVGKRLGLSRFQMARLGMAALLHDVGRLSVPEVSDDMDAGTWEMFKGHSRKGVETLLKLKGLNESAVSAMIVAYEHHRNPDGSGYPEQLEPKEMNLFSRIARIADNFDAATSSGVYGRISVPPPKVIEIMRHRSGQYYDRDLMALFLGAMGLYPVGSFVLLSDGTAGIVTSPGHGKEGISRPSVTLVCSGSPETGREVDLMERDGCGRYRRRIVGLLEPSKCRVNVYRHLL